MIAQARQRDPDGDYQLLAENRLPFADEEFDLVFQSIVFHEYSSQSMILETLEDFYRVLSPHGKALVITSSDYSFLCDWASFLCDLPENRNLKSGDQAKVIVRGTDVVFMDYYWSEADYERLFGEARFRQLRKLQPLADGTEPFEWVSERVRSNWTVYLLEKMDNKLQPAAAPRRR